MTILMKLVQCLNGMMMHFDETVVMLNGMICKKNIFEILKDICCRNKGLLCEIIDYFVADFSV